MSAKLNIPNDAKTQLFLAEREGKLTPELYLELEPLAIAEVDAFMAAHPTPEGEWDLRPQLIADIKVYMPLELRERKPDPVPT